MRDFSHRSHSCIVHAVTANVGHVTHMDGSQEMGVESGWREPHRCRMSYNGIAIYR